MKWYIGVIFIIIWNSSALETDFAQTQIEAVEMNNKAQHRISSDSRKLPIAKKPKFKVKQSQLGLAPEVLMRDQGAGKDLVDIHKNRSIYIVDDTDPMISRSENILDDPKTKLDESDEIIATDDNETIETCEECPNTEYTVSAVRTKVDLVHMTASQTCTKSGNHGRLIIKVELSQVDPLLIKKGGPFTNVKFISKKYDGPYIYENYTVDGHAATVKKTIEQENHPGIYPGCYLARDLENYVINPINLVNNLLGLSDESSTSWGEIGMAQLHVEPSRYYFIDDGRASYYEELAQRGLCEYHSIEDIDSDNKSDRRVTQRVTYSCRAKCTDTCAALKARGCSREPSSECVEYADDQNHTCVRYRWTFRCKNRIGIKKHKFSGKNAFCLGGECIDSSYDADPDMVNALGYLSILDAVGKDMGNGIWVSVFRGNALACSKHVLNFTDCCRIYGSKGWGVGVGLSKCSSEEKDLAEQRTAGRCILVGTYCAERTPVTKTCIRKKTVFCCFGSKFAKLLQEQGKAQLGKGFGDPEHPSCNGFSARELSKIDFSKLDLSEIVDDMIQNFHPPTEEQLKEHFAKGEEFSKINQYYKHPDKETEYLQENLKHMTSSMRRKIENTKSELGDTKTKQAWN